MTAYLKAYAALVGAVATALLGVYTSDTQVGKILTVAAVVGTAFATWRVPNLDPKAQHQQESVQPPQRGYGALELLIVVVVVVILIVVLLRLV
jgi:uncharacterized membrane protein YidH (DUF202 family)